jgi:RNA:NAD 2'-phosphotransferase (TPT1/KptA family)
LTPPAAYRLKQLGLQSSEVLDHVLAHDISGLYEVAAKRALASREIDRKHIGGRTGVYLAEDYSGVVKDNFVFKPTVHHLADREESRASVISQAIARAGLDGKFQLAQTMARSHLPAGDPLRQLGYDVIVARQYHSGEILADYVMEGPGRAFSEEALRQAARFLALIHAAERATPNCGEGMRNQVWRKEFGRWLKTLRIDDAPGVFAVWWARMTAVPCFVRRDAHPLNWIVTPNRDIIALDLEGCGWRPAGYELAQLTDDQPMISVDKPGWRLRRDLVKVYRDELVRFGVAIDHWFLEDAYEAALIARATRLLTEPAPTPGSRDHGLAVLKYLGRRARRRETRQLAETIRKAWLVRLGVTTEVHQDRGQISAARRRHISRSLAYELRHGSRAEVDAHGWALATDLVEALNNDGLRTDISEIRTVANAIDEPRFEVSGGRIRARYGHTRAVEIEYSPQMVHQVVYHGTAVSNLNAIFGGEGLRAMGRLWVHLSSSAPAAIRTAKRHGPGVLLSVNCADVPGGVLEAGGTVYLAKGVQPDGIRIVTPTQMFLMGYQSSSQ